MPYFNINTNTNTNTNTNGSYSNGRSNLFLRQFHSLNSSNNMSLSRVIDQSNGHDTSVFLNSHRPNNANHFDLTSTFGQQHNQVVSQFHSLNSSNNNLSRVIVNQPNVPHLNADHFDFNSVVATQNNRLTHVPNQLTVGQSQRGQNGIEFEAGSNNYLALPTEYSFQTSLDFIDGKLCLTQTVKETRKLLGPPITQMSTLQELPGQSQRQTQVNPPITVNEGQPTPNYYHHHQQQPPVHQSPPNPSPGNHRQSTSNMSGQGDNVQMLEEMSYDGMTHSLPCNKYGPYTCPSCNEVFSTSNLFASHVATHYKHETPEQRRRRRVARSRGKNASGGNGVAAVVRQPFKRQQQSGSGSNNYVVGDFGCFGVPEE